MNRVLSKICSEIQIKTKSSLFLVECYLTQSPPESYRDIQSVKQQNDI